MRYLLIAFFLFGCGGAIAAEEMKAVKDVTCPSLLEAYYDAVAAGVEMTPEELAIVRECL